MPADVVTLTIIQTAKNNVYSTVKTQDKLAAGTHTVTPLVIVADAPMVPPPAGDIDTSADIVGISPTGSFVDFVITKGLNSDKTERGYKDPTTGASTGPFGSIDKTLIEAGVEVFGAYARIYPRAGNKVSLDAEVVLKANDPDIEQMPY